MFKKGEHGVVWWRDGKRRCSGCDDYYEPVAFGSVKRDQVGDGLDIYCRECRKQAGRRSYARRREREIAETLEWRKHNRRHYLAYMRRYHRERQAVKRVSAELARGGRAGQQQQEEQVG